MPYYPTGSFTIREATATSSIPSINKTAVFDVNNFKKEFSTAYYSIEDLNADTSIPKASSAYRALAAGFKDAAARSLPIYLAKIEAATTILTPSVAEGDFSFTIDVYNTTTGVKTVDGVVVEATGTAGDTVGDAVDALVLDAASINTTEATFVNTADTLVITAAADRQVVIVATSEETLVPSFTTTKTAAQAFADFTSENPDDWYYATTTNKTVEFVLAMADVIEATESSDFPKLFHVSDNEPSSIIAQTDPSAATDILGLLEDGNYSRTSAEWHEQSDEIYPEVSHVTWVGSYEAGTKGRAFSQQCSVPAARHPVLGRLLTKAEAGFVTDRNAVVRFKEMGLTIYKTGKLGTAARGAGAWMQNKTIADWTRLTMAQRLINLLVNEDTAGNQISFAANRMEKVADTLNSVLSDGVDRGVFTGFEPVQVPDSVPFADQAMRTLDGLKFKAYLSGGVNFVIVDGVLTYREETEA